MEKDIKGLYSFTNSPVRIIEYENEEWKILLTEPFMLSRDSFKEVVAIAYNCEVFYLSVKRLNQVGYNFLRISSEGTVTPIGPILSVPIGELVVTGNTTVMSAREMDYTFPEQVFIAENAEIYEEEIPAELANSQYKVWGEVIGLPFFMQPVVSSSNVFHKETSFAQDATQFIYTSKKEKRRRGDRKPFKLRKLKGWEIEDLSFRLGWFIAKKDKIYFLYHFSNPIPIKGPCKFMELRYIEDTHIVLSVHDPTTNLYRQYTLLADATIRPYVEEDSLDPEDPNVSHFPSYSPPHILTLSKGEVLIVTEEQAEFLYFMENTRKRDTSPQQQSVYQQILNESIVVWSSSYGFVHGFNLKNVAVNKGSVQFEKRVSTNVAVFSLGTSLYLRYVGSSNSFLDKDVEFLGGSIVTFERGDGTMHLYFGDESFQISLQKIPLEEAARQHPPINYQDYAEGDYDNEEDYYADHYDEEESYHNDSEFENRPEEPDHLEQYGITLKENAIVVEAYDKVILDTGKIVSLHDILEEVDNWLLQEI